MVPLRVISENLGANVNWDNSQITITKNDMQVVLKLNSNKVVKNGETELLDVKPYVRKNRTFVPMRFLAETFGCDVNYKNGIVTVDTKPFVIDGKEVKVVQNIAYATIGGVARHIKGNSYNEAIYKTFIENKGSKVETPSDYSYSFFKIPDGGYYLVGQFDFLDQAENSIVRFDIYTLLQESGEPTNKPLHLIHMPAEDQWYLFNETGSQTVFQLFNNALENGFVKVIESTIP